MKKIFIIILLCAIAGSLKAQYTAEVETWAGDPSKDVWVAVGNLPTVATAGVFQKLKIEIFGGQWVSSTGETTFYITTRDALVINEVRNGGTNSGQFTLRAFNNSNGYTYFYIYTPGNSYTAYSVRSTVIGGNGNNFNLTGNGTSQQLFQCTVQALVPPALPESGTELNLTINPIFITDGAGNIGINTLNPDPAYKLSVNGTIRAKEIKVETGWSDYVFDEHYFLRSLKETENYIFKNKHLPDVPSADDVKQWS